MGAAPWKEHPLPGLQWFLEGAGDLCSALAARCPSVPSGGRPGSGQACYWRRPTTAGVGSLHLSRSQRGCCRAPSFVLSGQAGRRRAQCHGAPRPGSPVVCGAVPRPLARRLLDPPCGGWHLSRAGLHRTPGPAPGSCYHGHHQRRAGHELDRPTSTPALLCRVHGGHTWPPGGPCQPSRGLSHGDGGCRFPWISPTERRRIQRVCRHRGRHAPLGRPGP